MTRLNSRRARRVLVGALAGSFLGAALAALPARAAELKIATLSPDGSSWMKSMRGAADRVSADTAGRVTFKFYPGGVMGNDDAVLRKIRIGQLQGGAVTGGSLSRAFADTQLYNLPLKFNNFAEVDHVRAGMDQLLAEGIERGGFVTFGLAEGGFAYVLSKAPVRSVADLRAQKVWIPNNDQGALLAVRAFGVNPIPLHLSDVLAGLQTGLVDTVATSPIGAIALHWHTQVKYMSDLPIMYFFATLAIDKRVFGRLSEADQRTVRTHMSAAFADIDRQNRADNVAALDALLAQGITLLELNDAQRQDWYRLAAKAEQEMVGSGVVSRELLDVMDGRLQRLRDSSLPAAPGA